VAIPVKTWITRERFDALIQVAFDEFIEWYGQVEDGFMDALKDCIGSDAD